MTHWHEEAELTLITKGSCIYQIDLVDYEVNEGDLLFIPPLLLHSIRLNGTDDFCSETYVFHVNFLGEMQQIYAPPLSYTYDKS